MPKVKADKPVDSVVQHTEALVTENHQRYVQQGQAVHFGLNIRIALNYLVEGYLQIWKAQGVLSDPKYTAFQLPVQDATLIHKPAARGLKSSIRIYMLTKVRELIARDERCVEFDKLCRQASDHKTEQGRKAGLNKLLFMCEPYAEHAWRIFMDDAVNYNPFNPDGIVGHKIWRCQR